MGGARAIGKLTRVTVAAGGAAGATGYEENRVYSSDYGYPQDTKRRIDGAWHWISHSYGGNGLPTLQTPDRATGAPEALTTGPGMLVTVQNLEFDRDRGPHSTATSPFSAMNSAHRSIRIPTWEISSTGSAPGSSKSIWHR